MLEPRFVAEADSKVIGWAVLSSVSLAELFLLQQSIVVLFPNCIAHDEPREINTTIKKNIALLSQYKIK